MYSFFIPAIHREESYTQCVETQLSPNINTVVISATYNHQRYPKHRKEETETDAFISLTFDGGTARCGHRRQPLHREGPVDYRPRNHNADHTHCSHIRRKHIIRSL